MKKIIYSFVIMIAAGSLFTSCVENTEPQGIKDIRQAKADYLESLAKVRDADAELVKAQAAYQSAQIAVVEADAALKQAEANIAQALADAAQLGVAYLDAKLQIELEDARAQAEIKAVQAQEELAKAQFKYEQTLRDLVAKSVGLNEEEVKVLEAKVKNLKDAQVDYHKAFVAVEKQKKAIWEKEYQHDSLGKGVIDWEGEIALAEALIASDLAKIADLEEMKEGPETIQAYLKVYQDSIQELRKDSLVAVQEKELYEITVLKEASKAYNEAWTKFVKDSVGDPVKFTFKQESSLIDVEKGLDAQFKVFVQTYASNKVTFKDNKFTVEEKDAADYKGVENDVKALKTIVEALNRDQVVLDNIADSTTIEAAKKDYEKADSTYKADYAILKAGLEKYDVYTLANDTLGIYQKAYKTAQEDSTKAAKKLAGDTTTVLKNVTENLAPAYKKAVKDFVDAAVLFKDNVRKDTVELINTVNALGNAQNAYIGRQDTVRIKREFTVGGEKRNLETTVKFNEIVVKDFKLNDLSETPFFGVILSAANCSKDVGGITDAKVAEKVKAKKVGEYQETSKFAFNLSDQHTTKDTIDWFKANAIGAYGDFTADSTDLAKKAKIAEAYRDTVGKCNQKVAEAKTAFTNIGKKFWNDVNFDADKEEYKIVWSDKTFSEPSNCVVFNLDEDTIVSTTPLKVALDGIYLTTEYTKGDKKVNDCPIFFGPNVPNGVQKLAKGTEFARALYLKQVYEALGSYESRTAQLKNINAQVEALDKAFTAAKTNFETANAAYVAGYTRLTGDKPDKGVKVETLEKNQNVDKGKWTLKGKQLELANQFAPEYPEIVKNAVQGVAAIEEKIAGTQDFINFLSASYIDYKNLEEGKSYKTIKDIIDALDVKIVSLKRSLAILSEYIDDCKFAIAQIEAGYDPYTIEVKVLNDNLARLEAELERAEAQLKIAQAEYDEVIALYGVNE